MNLSWSEGCFSDVLKKLVLTPMHEKTDATNIVNYRPIASQRIWEYCILNRLTLILKQTPYYCQKPTEHPKTPFLELYANLLRIIDQHRMAIGIFCDLHRRHFITYNIQNCWLNLMRMESEAIWQNGLCHASKMEQPNGEKEI